MSQGTFFLGLYFILLVIIILWFIKKIGKFSEGKIYIAIKEKIMWSSLLRGQI